MKEAPAEQGEPLVMFVIYKHPLDWPHHFVARRLFVLAGEEEPTPDKCVFATHISLIHLRSMLPPGLACLARCPDDDPEIVETWL